MALENWIDRIVVRWAQIETHTGGSLRSYKLYEINEFPEIVTPPCVLTYPTGVNITYSVGGPIVEHWTGRSDFYLFGNVSKTNLPQLVVYFKKIRNTAISSITLNNTCDYFMIDSQDIGAPSIQGPVVLQYGDGDNPMHGLVVNWKVKENISNEDGVTVAA